MTDTSFEVGMDRGRIAAPGARHPGGRAGASRHEAHRAALRREYCAYFAVIFVLTLPLAFAVWIMRAVRGLRWPDRGPLRAAWSQAAIIAPMILSA